MSESVLRLGIEPADAVKGAKQFEGSAERVSAAAKKATGDLSGTEKGMQKVGVASTDLSALMQKLGLAIGGLAIAKMAKDAILLSARYETLGVVMEVVGRNAGKTVAEMQGFEAGLRKTGIAAIEARDNLARMAGAQIDLSNATDLARIAQDAAVIAGTNSSEAFSRLIDGISTGQPRILRTMGLFIDFDGALKDFAASTGRSVDALTELEKTQIRANAVLKGGGQIAGTYEAAMTTAGKQLGSMKRLVDDLRVTLGDLGLPAFTELVFSMSQSLKDANTYLMNNKAAFVAWANVGVKAVMAVLAPFKALVRVAFNFGQTVGEGFTIIGQALAGDFAGMRETAARIAQNSLDVMDAGSDYLAANVALLDALKVAAEGGDLVVETNKKITASTKAQTAAVIELTAAQKQMLAIGPGFRSVTNPFAPSAEVAARRTAAQANLRSGAVTLPNVTATRTSTPGFTGAEGAGGGILSSITGGLKSAVDALGQGFSSLWASMGPAGLAIAALFDVVKGALEPLQPVIQMLREPLHAVGVLIGQTLAPVLKFLIPIVKGLAKAFTYGQQAMGYLIQALGWFIDHLVPDFISKVGQGMEQWGKDIVANSKAARKAMDATNDFADALNATTTNIPQVLPLAYLRMMAGAGNTFPGAGSGSTGSGGGWTGYVGGGGGKDNVGGKKEVQAFAAGAIVVNSQAMDGARLLAEVQDEIRRQKGSGKIVDLDRWYQARGA